MEVTNNLQPIVDKKYYSDGNRYYFTQKLKLFPFTNFVVHSVRRLILIDEKNHEHEQFVIQLKNIDGRIIEIEVLSSELRKIPIAITEKSYGFHIATDEFGKKAWEMFNVVMSEILFQLDTNGRIFTQKKYFQAKWSEMQSNGTRVFMHGGMSNCESPKILLPPCENWNSVCNTIQSALKIFEVGDLDVTMPVLIHSLSAFALTIFEDAGFPIRHSLMLVGASGYKKTSFVRETCALFLPQSERIHSVRSTEAAMNVLLKSSVDDVVVLDDFNFEGSQKDVSDKLKIVRSIIRSISDGVIRAKFENNKKVTEYKPRTLALITGETKMTSQLTSSELRYLKIEMKRPFDGKKLLIFQQNPTILKFLFSEWIRFLEKNYVSCVTWVRNEIPKRRAELDLSEGRLTDAYVQMCLVAEIFQTFVLQYIKQEMLNDVMKNFSNVFSKILFEIITKQNGEAYSRDVHVAYVSEFFNLLGTNKIKIAPTIDHYLLNQSAFDGYAEGDVIMLEKDAVYKKIKSAYAERGEFFPASPDEVSKTLKENNLTICDKGTNSKRPSSKIVGRPRMLALIERRCLDLLDNIGA